jgi:hypothetical protein
VGSAVERRTPGGKITRPLHDNGQTYSGINILMLWASAMEQGSTARSGCRSNKCSNLMPTSARAKRAASLFTRIQLRAPSTTMPPARMSSAKSASLLGDAPSTNNYSRRSTLATHIGHVIDCRLKFRLPSLADRPSVGALNRENFAASALTPSMDRPQVLILGQHPNLVRPVRPVLQDFKNVHQKIAWRAMSYGRLRSHLPAA